MRRTFATRLLALVVLLLHSSAFAAASVLDGSVAARANATGSHVETASGKDCATHDEASCLLCRAGCMGAAIAPRSIGNVVAVRSILMAPHGAACLAATPTGPLHARAPPVA